MKFTDRQIKNLKITGERYEIWEGKGFGMRVSSVGSKSWVFVYHYQGRARRMTLGKYPMMSVAEAHTAHAQALTNLEHGIDPGAKLVNENREHRHALTVKGLMEEYLEKWGKQRKRSWEEDQRMLVKDVAPLIGHYKAKEVKKRDIIMLLDKVMERGSPIAANRTLAVVRRMFNFAVERDIIEITPCYGVKAPSKENKRDRSLSLAEIKEFWHGLNRAIMTEPLRLALKLQLVTAQRKGEVVAAEWDEFDLSARCWAIPGHKVKNSNAHVIPLSDLALDLLKDIKALSGESKWLFPSPNGHSAIGATAVDHALRRSLEKFTGIKPFTPHDLRRTAASQMTALGVLRLVVSKILNHVESSVTAIYDRHSYDKEKREALELWSNKVQEIIFS